MQIAAVLKSKVPSKLLAHGFQPNTKQMISDDVVWFGPREDLEENTDYVQLIPYVLVFSRQGTPKVLTYTRSKKGGEARLHGQRAIGFGGHIDLAQDNFDGLELPNLIDRCIYRELREELPKCSLSINPRFAGYVYNPATAVGRVHLGLVYAVELMHSPWRTDDGLYIVPEEPSDEIAACNFMTFTDLQMSLSFETNWESWAVFTIPFLTRIHSSLHSW